MEPQGNKSCEPGAGNGRELRFVVLRHEGYGALHWDLMVEVEGREPLATWRVMTPPEQWGEAVSGERIADHRRVYLDYEGEVSGGRGRVVRVEQGVLKDGWLAGQGGRWRLTCGVDHL